MDALNGVDQSSQGGSKDGGHFDADSADYFVFHAPYNKLVQKSYGRMHFVDARRKHARKLEGKNLFAEEKKAEEEDESDSPIAK